MALVMLLVIALLNEDRIKPHKKAAGDRKIARRFLCACFCRDSDAFVLLTTDYWLLATALGKSWDHRLGKSPQHILIVGQLWHVND
jgi:hypothetical protein